MIPTSLYSLLFPPNLLIALAVLSALSWWLNFRRTALLLMGTGAFWVIIWSLPITTLYAGGYLEKRYSPQLAEQYPKADAIVVLGGHIQGNRHNWFEPYESDRVIRRESIAAELFKANRSDLILLSGGALEGNVSDTAVMENTLLAQGIPQSSILHESKSKNTFENARLTEQTLHNLEHQHILLVTSALHMPRAMMAFEHRPMRVTPAPLPAQIIWPSDSIKSRWTPDLHTLLASQSIIKEYLGLVLYWLRLGKNTD